MYRITKGIHIHFAHVVHGHSGLCLGPHGHTWYFELTLKAPTLDNEGFVSDFSTVKRTVLTPIETCLDHAFAIGRNVYQDILPSLSHIGAVLLQTRVDVHGDQRAEECQIANRNKVGDIELPQLEVVFNGSCKVCVFDFNPTSERLAEWLFNVASSRASYGIVVDNARVYETLHPVASYAEYSLDI